MYNKRARLDFLTPYDGSIVYSKKARSDFLSEYDGRIVYSKKARSDFLSEYDGSIVYNKSARSDFLSEYNGSIVYNKRARSDFFDYYIGLVYGTMFITKGKGQISVMNMIKISSHEADARLFHLIMLKRKIQVFDTIELFLIQWNRKEQEKRCLQMVSAY